MSQNAEFEKELNALATAIESFRNGLGSMLLESGISLDDLINLMNDLRDAEVPARKNVQLPMSVFSEISNEIFYSDLQVAESLLKNCKGVSDGERTQHMCDLMKDAGVILIGRISQLPDDFDILVYLMNDGHKCLKQLRAA